MREPSSYLVAACGYSPEIYVSREIGHNGVVHVIRVTIHWL